MANADLLVCAMRNKLSAPQLLLLFSALVEIPIAMIFLSQVLGKKALRWATYAAAPVTAIFVIGGGSPTLPYFFFAAMEVLAMAIAVWLTWRWTADSQT